MQLRVQHQQTSPWALQTALEKRMGAQRSGRTAHIQWTMTAGSRQMLLLLQSRLHGWKVTHNLCCHTCSCFCYWQRVDRWPSSASQHNALLHGVSLI